VKRVLVNRGDHVARDKRSLSLKTRIWRPRQTRVRASTNKRRPAYQMTHGRDGSRRKDQGTGRRAGGATGARCGAKAYENRVALQREGALAQKLVDDAKVAMVQARGQLENGSAPP